MTTRPQADGGLQRKHHRWYTGKIDDHAMRKGWFFGTFAGESLLQSDLVEVAWQRLPNLTPAADQTHFHLNSVEINIVISGWIDLKIEDVKQHVAQGEFYVIWPETTVSQISTASNTELIVIRAPGLPNDKVLGKPE